MKERLKKGKEVKVRLRTNEVVVFREAVIPVERQGEGFHVYLRYFDPNDQEIGVVSEEILDKSSLRIFFNGFGLASGPLDSTEELLALEALYSGRPLLFASISELPPNIDNVTSYEQILGNRTRDDSFDMGVDARIVLEAVLKQGINLNRAVEIIGYSEGSLLAQAFAVEVDLWQKMLALRLLDSESVVSFDQIDEFFLTFLEARQKVKDFLDTDKLPQNEVAILSPMGLIDLNYGPENFDNRGWNALLNFWTVVLQVFEIEGVVRLAEIYRKGKGYKHLSELIDAIADDPDSTTQIAKDLKILRDIYEGRSGASSAEKQAQTVSLDEADGFSYFATEFSLESFKKIIWSIVRLAVTRRDGLSIIFDNFKEALAAGAEEDGLSEVTYWDSLKHIFSRLFSLENEFLSVKEKINRAVYQLTKLGSKVADMDNLGSNWTFTASLPRADAMMSWHIFASVLKRLNLELDDSITLADIESQSNVSVGFYRYFRALFPNVGKFNLDVFP